MEVGYELIKQQLFFRWELKERVYWFIRLRWITAGGGLACLALARLAGLSLPWAQLTGLLVLVALYNLVLAWLGRRLGARPEIEIKHYLAFAHVQVVLDLLTLFGLIYFTGGPASPFLIFTIFHVILAGILLSPGSCFLYAGLILAGLGGMILWANLVGFPPTWRTGQTGWLASLGGRLPQVLGPYGIFAAGLLIAAYLTTSVKVALRLKSRELLRVSRELELSTTKLTSLYEMIKEIGLLTKSQEVMDAATKNAAKIMGVKGCSLKLLDPERYCLRFASTFGLSEDYVSKDCISVAKSEINRRIVEGSLYSIGSIDESSYFQYPEEIRQEGIASMLCLPLKVDRKTLGVFCVYSGQTNYFNEADAAFFSLMTDLTALAMERVAREEAKTWFLNKAAHQLRSPLSAVMSMLQVLAGGYLGPVDDKQAETLGRCQKRLAILAEVVNDLLKLAAGRQALDQAAAATPDPAAPLTALLPLYQTKAAEKGLTLRVEIGPNLPPVLASARLLDDVYANLLSNALKYTPAGGRVTIRLAALGSEKVLFEVADTGIGLTPADQARLFSEFFRAEKAKAMVEEGTGLGLVIVKELLEKIGGAISVVSRPGQGSTFSCLLPAAQAER